VRRRLAVGHLGDDRHDLVDRIAKPSPIDPPWSVLEEFVVWIEASMPTT